MEQLSRELVSSLVVLSDSDPKEAERLLSMLPAGQRERVLAAMLEAASTVPVTDTRAFCRTPMDLGKMVVGRTWMAPKHLELLNDALVKLVNGQLGTRRLMITMPPRHGKSMLTSEMFPAWFLGTFPEKRIILASYEADFAAEWGRKARSILEEHGSWAFGVGVSTKSSAADRWDIECHRGGMRTAGVGGPVTGKGADLLIVDDPIKNSAEANSYVYREKIWQWWQSTAYTRLEPDACAVVIQTRWHDDDLSGRLLKHHGDGGERWHVYDFPAVATCRDALGRSEGDALWPERYDQANLGRIRKAVGEYVWACLYQQSPTQAEGDIIKREWFRYWEPHGDGYSLFRTATGQRHVIRPEECQRFAIVDCAASSDDVKREKSGKTPSRSVIMVFDFHRQGGWLVLVDCRFGYWDFNKLHDESLAVINEYNPSFFGIEDEKTGKALLSMLRNQRVRAISHQNKGKLERFGPALSEFREGKCFFPINAKFLPPMEAELTSYDGHPDTPFDFGDPWGYAAVHADRQHRQGGWGGVQKPIKVGGMPWQRR